MSALLFNGSTEMHRRCREFDWAATPLGAVDQWPAALRIATATVLAAGLPNIVLWGRDLTQIYNDAYARLIRAKHPSALGRGNQHVWPEVWHLNEPIYARVFAGETVTLHDAYYPLERESASEPGRFTLEEAYLTISYSPIRDEHGDVAGVLANMIETTSRIREQQLTEALRKSERRQAYLMQLGDSLRHVASPTEIKAIATRILGEHLGVNHAYYVDVDVDDEHVICEADYAHNAPSLVGRYPLSGYGPALAAEYRAGRTLVLSDSRNHPLVPPELSAAWEGIGIRAQVAVPLVKEGRFTAAFGVDQSTTRDWTDEEVDLVQETAERTWAAVARAQAEAVLRESEVRFRNMADHAPVMLWVTEADGRCSFLNRQWLEFTGQTLDEGLGFGWLDAVHPDDAAHSEQIFRDATAANESFRLEYRLRGVDGEYHWCIDAAVPRLSVDGTFIGFIGSVVNVDDQHRAHVALEHARAAAEQANRAKSDFLAVMSHELRTPLNAIGGYAELLEMGIRGPVTDLQREDLARIQRSQRHLLGLVNEVLNYAKVESGTVRYELTDVHVRDALAGAEALVAPQARSKGLTFIPGDSTPSLIVRADAEKLRQVLVNLLSNAVKFTERGGRIELVAEKSDDSVAIHVRDTGVGIPSEKLGAVFEPFVQVRSDLSRPFEGTGLGLAISRELARGMGGDLVAASTFGAGSTFTLSLPLASPHDVD